MKKIALAASIALCGTTCAWAQSPANSVTLYGIVDVSVRSQSGYTAAYAAAPGNTTTVASGVGPTSRWGIRGSEDLGGGLRAIFNLESGINVDTGAPANASTYFDRASVVGLAGTWGQITLGRQNTLLADSAGVADPIGLRFAGLNPNVQVAGLTGHRLGIEFGATGSTTASNRVNNSAKLSVPIGPLVARAMYSAGEVLGSSSRQNSTGLGLDYRTPALNVTSAYTNFHDTNDRNLNAYNLGASWKTGGLTLMANTARNEADTSVTTKTTHRLVAVGAQYAVTPLVDVLAGYYHVSRNRTALANDGFGRLMVFVEYKLSRRSKVFVELDSTRWRNGYQGADNKSTSSGVSLGVTHSF